MWTLLVRNTSMNLILDRYLMCTSCETKDGFTHDYCKSLGLITGHAYSLLDVYDMDTGEK